MQRVKLALSTLTWRRYAVWYWRTIITPSFDIATACTKKIATAMCQIGYWTRWSHCVLETVPFITFTFADDVTEVSSWRPLNCKRFRAIIIKEFVSSFFYFASFHFSLFSSQRNAVFTHSRTFQSLFSQACVCVFRWAVWITGRYIVLQTSHHVNGKTWSVEVETDKKNAFWIKSNCRS